MYKNKASKKRNDHQNFSETKLFILKTLLQRLKRLKTPYKQGRNIYSYSIKIISIAL